MLSAKRDTPAAKKFLANALYRNGIPNWITVDISRSDTAGIKEVNKIFNRLQIPVEIDTVRSKHVNNMIEQDHRFIKWLTRLMPRLQMLHLSCRGICGHRSGRHNPQRSARNLDKRILSICRPRWRNSPNQSGRSKPRQSLRQIHTRLQES